MNKRYLHHLWTKIRRVRTWQLFLAFLLAGTVAVWALRQNNLRMIELRQAVYVADEKGGDVEAALQALRKHVYAHMNTDLAGGLTGVYPPIQLKYTYQRLQQTEKDRAKQDSAQIYTDAQNECERQNPNGFSGRSRVPCIEQYVAAHTTAEKNVPDALYKFNFTSPRWSPDIAGFSLALTILLLIALIVRIAVGRLAKNVLG